MHASFQVHIFVFIILVIAFGVALLASWGSVLAFTIRHHHFEKLYRYAVGIWTEKRALWVADEVSRLPKTGIDKYYDLNRLELDFQKENPYPGSKYKRFGQADISVWVSVWVSVASFIMAIIAVIGFVPYSSYYYYNYTLTGTVSKVHNVFGTVDDATTANYAVKLSNRSTEIYTDDTRILDYKGRSVTLFCNPNWQYNAQPYLTCEIVR